MQGKFHHNGTCRTMIGGDIATSKTVIRTFIKGCVCGQKIGVVSFALANPHEKSLEYEYMFIHASLTQSSNSSNIQIAPYLRIRHNVFQ